MHPPATSLVVCFCLILFCLHWVFIAAQELLLLWPKGFLLWSVGSRVQSVGSESRVWAPESSVWAQSPVCGLQSPECGLRVQRVGSRVQRVSLESSVWAQSPECGLQSPACGLRVQRVGSVVAGLRLPSCDAWVASCGGQVKLPHSRWHLSSLIRYQICVPSLGAGSSTTATREAPSCVLTFYHCSWKSLQIIVRCSRE